MVESLICHKPTPASPDRLRHRHHGPRTMAAECRCLARIGRTSESLMITLRRLRLTWRGSGARTAKTKYQISLALFIFFVVWVGSHCQCETMFSHALQFVNRRIHASSTNEHHIHVRVIACVRQSVSYWLSTATSNLNLGRPYRAPKRIHRNYATSCPSEQKFLGQKVHKMITLVGRSCCIQ